MVSAPPPSALYQLSYTAYHIYLSLIQAAGSHTSLRHTTQSPSALLDLQSGFCIIRSVCCDCVATIRPSILTTSLGLALLPICSVCCCVTATVMHQLVMLADSELTSSPPVVLTGWLPSLSTPSVGGLFRCRFSSGLCTTPCGITRHPSCHCVFSIFSLLTGIARCTSLGVCGRWRTRTVCSSYALWGFTAEG